MEDPNVPSCLRLVREEMLIALYSLSPEEEAKQQAHGHEPIVRSGVLAEQQSGRVASNSENLSRKSTGPRKLLSERELNTLQYVHLGYSNKSIAHRLEISEGTVKIHVQAILRKLNVRNRT